MYLPLFILASLGLLAFTGIAQAYPIRTAPSIRPFAHKTWIRRGDNPQRSEVCLIDKYSTVIPPKHKDALQYYRASKIAGSHSFVFCSITYEILAILYAKLRTMSTFLHLSYHFTPYRDILTTEGVKTNDKGL